MFSAMEVESFCSGPVTLEKIGCSVMEALVVETAMVTEKAVFGFFVVIGSLNNGSNVFEKVHRTDEVFPLSDYSRVNTVDAENTVTEDDVKNDSDGCEDDEEEVYSVSSEAGEEGTHGIEGDTEDDVEANGNEGSDGGGENNDDSDDEEGEDEDEWEEEDDDDDDEEEEEEDEWEEEDEDEDDDSDDDEPIFKHARDVYKPEIFDMFREEYKKLNSLTIDVKDEGFNKRGLVFKYEIGIFFDCYNHQQVTAEPMDGMVECSCKYFEYAGILCSHALLALRCLRMESIPEQYILKRFTKDGKVGTAEEPRTLIKKDKQHPLSLPQHLYHI